MHDCPRCGQACDCSGDIDDCYVLTEEWALFNCQCDCDEFEEPNHDDPVDWEGWECVSQPSQVFDRGE